MSDIPELDQEAASLAQMLDAVLDAKAQKPKGPDAARLAHLKSPEAGPTGSPDGPLQRTDVAHGPPSEARSRAHIPGVNIEKLREVLASLSAQREQLLEALEAANRKAAIGELNSELEELTGEIESLLVRYAALMHLTKGTPFGLLNITSLFGREGRQRAQQMVADIRKGWRQV